LAGTPSCPCKANVDRRCLPARQKRKKKLRLARPVPAVPLRLAAEIRELPAESPLPLHRPGRSQLPEFGFVAMAR